MKKTMKKVSWLLLNGVFTIMLLFMVILTADVALNLNYYMNNGFDANTALEWAMDTTEWRIVKPITNWLNSFNTKSEVLEFPMIVQSIQGNTLINEYKSGR